MKKGWEITKKVLTWLLVLVTVCMTVFVILSATSLGGYRLYVVQSDSMSATDFDAGDLIISVDVDPEELVEGDIITFQSTSRESMGETVTHKIRSIITTENGELAFQTYGTTSGQNDSAPAQASHVLGKYVGSIPYMGYVVNFMKTPAGYLICIFLPFVILIGIQIKNLLKAFGVLRKERKAELQNEREELKSEREKLEQAMAELRQLQMQMASGQNNANPPSEQTPAEEASTEEASTEEAPGEQVSAEE